MKERIINIRVMFVSFCGLLVGILFSIFNTFQNFTVLKTVLFSFIILAISLFLFLYGFFTRKRNSLYRARKNVSSLLMVSGVCFLLTVICGVCIVLKPYSNLINLNSYTNEVKVEGVVSDYVSGKATHTKFIISDCYIESDGVLQKCDFKICVYADSFTDVSLGDKVILNNCILNKYSYAKDNELIKLCQGLGYQTYVNFDNIDGESGTVILRDKIKDKTKNIIFNNLNVDNGNIVYATLFGEKEGLSNEIKNSFSYAGISHILAVSGLHVGILATAILFLLKKIKMNKYIRVIVLSSILFFYAYLCSFSPSVCRAGIMTILLSICDALQIEYDGLSSLSIAGIIILLFSPLQVLSLSFQLSFLSVFGIIAFTPTITRLFCKIKIPKTLASVLAISISTNIAILPVCANAFTEVSLLGVISNIFILPIFTVSFILSFIILIISFIFSGFGVLLVIPNLFLHLIKVLADFSVSLHSLIFRTFENAYSILFLLCVSLLLLHYLMVKKIIKTAIILPLMIIAIMQFSFANMEYSCDMNTLAFSYQYNSNVVFYLEDDNVTMIGSNIEYNELLYTLKDLKIRKIDTIIAYDLQLNEIDNLRSICENCNTTEIYIPEKFNYKEISSKFNNVKYYENEINLNSLKLDSVNYLNQTIGIYLNIYEIGDILIPELKPTKKEGAILSNYRDVDYFYQPKLSYNVDIDILTPEKIITNSGEGDMISLENLGKILINKEGMQYEI